MTLHVLITGANRGIGLELCRHYVDAGARVFAVCRKSSVSLDALDLEVIDSIDVSSSEQVSRLRQIMQGIPMDILVNNAGILRSQSFNELDNEQYLLEQFNINALGPIRVITALKECLSQGSKVIMITSRMGSIADNSSGGSYGYRMSKCALNAAGQSLAIDLKPQGIAVALIHPGYVTTDMTQGRGDIAPDVAATRIAQRIHELDINHTGSFLHSNGETLPW